MRIYTYFFLLLAFSCNTNYQKSNLFTLPKEWVVPDSVSLKTKKMVEKGGIEYFFINGTQFRFKKNYESSNLYDIQAKHQNNWSTNITLSMPQYNFFLTNDFDLDGYFDLFFIDRSNITIHFFDKMTNAFDSKQMQFSSDRALLDSNKLIYGVNNHTSYDWDIDIFSIKNREKKYLYKAKIFFKQNIKTNQEEVVKAVIQRYLNGKNDEVELINTVNINKNYVDFSLLQFMKDVVKNYEYD